MAHAVYCICLTDLVWYSYPMGNFRSYHTTSLWIILTTFLDVFYAGIRLHDVSQWPPCQSRRSWHHQFLPCLGQETGNTTSLTLRIHPSCPCMLFGRRVKKLYQSYRRNFKVNVLGVVKQGEKVQDNFDMLL